jgi:hypothetical protein
MSAVSRGLPTMFKSYSQVWQAVPNMHATFATVC